MGIGFRVVNIRKDFFFIEIGGKENKIGVDEVC